MLLFVSLKSFIYIGEFIKIRSQWPYLGNPEQNLATQQSGALNENFSQTAEQVAIAFGENAKAQMAAKAMFQLVHAHGDILREVLLCIFVLENTVHKLGLKFFLAVFKNQPYVPEFFIRS